MSDARKSQVALDCEIPIELEERLIEYCARIGFSEDIVINAALRRYLDRMDKDSPLPENGHEPPKGAT